MKYPNTNSPVEENKMLFEDISGNETHGNFFCHCCVKQIPQGTFHTHSRRTAESYLFSTRVKSSSPAKQFSERELVATDGVAAQLPTHECSKYMICQICGAKQNEKIKGS